MNSAWRCTFGFHTNKGDIMKRKAIFTSNGLIEEIKRATDGEQKNLFIEDMVTGAYFRCFGVVEDKSGDLILRVKSEEDLAEGNHDLYMDEEW